MIYFFIILSFLLSLALTISFYYSIKFAMIILNVETQIEESLDQLDDQYRAIDIVTQRNLASDDPSVIEIHKQLKLAKDTILLIANKLSSSISKNEVEEE